jgi:hypothetical protein
VLAGKRVRKYPKIRGAALVVIGLAFAAAYAVRLAARAIP